MPHSIANARNILLALNFGQKLRAIIVLLFAVTIGAMLLTFPGPLFHTATKNLASAERMTMTSMIDADAQAAQLRQRMTAALDILKAKSVNESNVR